MGFARRIVGAAAGIILLIPIAALAQQTTVISPSTPAVNSALSTTVTLVAGPEAGPGLVYSRQLRRIVCYNPNATIAYVQMFNALVANVTLGTTAPYDFLPVPATSSNGWSTPSGDSYPAGISAAATTTPTGNTAPGVALVCSFSVF